MLGGVGIFLKHLILANYGVLIKIQVYCRETKGVTMKEKKAIQYRLPNRRMVVILDNGKCFVECTARELPNEIKIRIKESINNAEILKKIVM
jgi:hypothetical protein